MCNAIKTEDLKLTAYNSKFNVFNMGGLSGAPLCIIVYMHGMNDTIIQEDKVYLLPSTLTPGDLEDEKQELQEVSIAPSPDNNEIPGQQLTPI